jgi:dUTPase
MENVMEIPEYIFALRENLKDKKEFLPTKADDKATGWDVRAALDKSEIEILPFDYVKIPLGIRGFCPDGWWYELKPRSSTFGKKRLHALIGTIDENYEGELIFACQYIPGNIVKQELVIGDPVYSIKGCIPPLVIAFGEAIGQIIPIKRQDAKMTEASNEELDARYKNRNGTRGVGGFGSTDKVK